MTCKDVRPEFAPILIPFMRMGHMGQVEKEMGAIKEIYLAQ